MSALSNSLLEFILGLLGNEEEMRKFDSNKAQYMKDAGYGGCEDEVDDYRRMVDDYKPASYGHSHGGGDKVYAARDHGHADYVAVKHVTEHHHHPAAVTHHHAGPVTKNHVEHNNYGDTYKIWNDDGAVAIGGGVALGEDAEIEDSAVVGGDNFGQVAGDDATAFDDAFSGNNNVNGSVNGSNLEAGDGNQQEPAAANTRSAAASGKALSHPPRSGHYPCLQVDDVTGNAVICANTGAA